MQDIGIASAEQEKGIEQVNRAISEIDGITQKNAALMEEAATAAASMKEQAGQLKGIVNVFQLGAASRA